MAKVPPEESVEETHLGVSIDGWGVKLALKRRVRVREVLELKVMAGTPWVLRMYRYCGGGTWMPESENRVEGSDTKWEAMRGVRRTVR